MTDSNHVEAFIFFSVDIVNSAAYKSQHINDWGGDFKAFLEGFPDEVNGTVRSYEKVIGLPDPKIWKRLGDEILFHLNINEFFNVVVGKNNLTRYELVLHYTICFKKAINRYNQKSDEKLNKHERAFKLKGTAWFANLVCGPNYDEKYGNIIIDFEKSNSGGKKEYDFIGRQIDIGFRIGKYSTLNKFVISVEYAILLLRDNYLTLEDEGIKIYYDGRKVLKGILEHLGYPIIYIDMEDKLEHSENNLMMKNEIEPNQIKLMRYLQEYIKATNSILYYPFVYEEKNGLFNRKPF